MTEEEYKVKRKRFIEEMRQYFVDINDNSSIWLDAVDKFIDRNNNPDAYYKVYDLYAWADRHKKDQFSLISSTDIIDDIEKKVFYEATIKDQNLLSFFV